MSGIRAIAALAGCAALSACALLGPGSVDESGPGVMRAGTRAPAAAQALVTAGQGKAEVAAALGQANAIRFDSGWEVWVYRWLGRDNSTSGATELVVLFDPRGTVRKTRLRRGTTQL